MRDLMGLQMLQMEGFDPPAPPPPT